jgi:hypothetical protein
MRWNRSVEEDCDVLELKPEGVSTYSAPFSARLSDVSRVLVKKTAGQRVGRAESAAGGRSGTGRLCEFSGDRPSQNPRKSIYVDEGVESSESRALDAGGERSGRVAVSPASHSSRGVPYWGARLPSAVTHSVHPWSTDARRGQEPTLPSAGPGRALLLAALFGASIDTAQLREQRRDGSGRGWSIERTLAPRMEEPRSAL